MTAPGESSASEPPGGSSAAAPHGSGMRRVGREALIREALTALAADPGAAMGEISQAIGVGRTTLYRHFGDRESLVAEVARFGARMFVDAFLGARPDDGSGLEAVERVCRELFTVPEVLTLLFADNPIITDDHFAEVERRGRPDHAGERATASATDSGVPRDDGARDGGARDGGARDGGAGDGDPLERIIARGQGDGSITRDVPVEWAAAFVFLTIGSGHLYGVSTGVTDPARRARALELTIRAVRRTLAADSAG